MSLVYYSTKRLSLVKIVGSVVSFYLKYFSDSAILNKWEFFSGMVNKCRDLPWGYYNFSMSTMIVFWNKMLGDVIIFPKKKNYIKKTITSNNLKIVSI